MDNSKVIHVHDVLGWIREKNSPVSLEEIENVFGGSNRFTNCREDNYSIAEIVEFMISRGKVERLADGRLQALEIPACNH